MDRPTLVVQTVNFGGTEPSDYAAARELGGELYDSLTRPRNDALEHGPGILVLSAVEPEYVDIHAADTVVVVPVLGKSTFLDPHLRNIALDTINTWYSELGEGHVLPVPLTENWRNLEGSIVGKLLLTELYGAQGNRQRTLDEIILSIIRLLDPGADRASLFISHAKADLVDTDDAAKHLHKYINDYTTASAFFDVNSLQAGASLDKQISESLEHGVFIAVRSDSYSSRDWCQKELLLAKQNALPALTVEVLKKGENLSSPYAGNGPTLIWAGDAQPIVSRAMVECLHAVHFKIEAVRTIENSGLPKDTMVLSRPPELLDVAQGPIESGRSQVVIHPDPELSTSHRELLSRANPRLKLVTPTTAFRRIGRFSNTVANPLDSLQVALSLSTSPDSNGPEGYTEEHVVDATVYLSRCLVSAGAHIAYGGDFRNGSYTEILANLVAVHRETAGAGNMLHSYLGVPIPVSSAPDDLPFNVYHMGSQPLSLEAQIPAVMPEGEQRVPNGLYFSDMRRVMTQRTHARVLIGGDYLPKIEENGPGYGGRYPGVVEEAWRSLLDNKPLYVVGGFGGAAGLVASLIQDAAIPEALQDRTWMDSDIFRKTAEEIDANSYRTLLNMPEKMESLAKEIHDMGSKLLLSDEASLTWNGLTVDENKKLLKTRDPSVIASLVLQGLQIVNRKNIEGKLEIELVEGSVTSGQDIEAIAIGVFDDLNLGGAGAALDELVSGKAAEAHANGESLIGLKSGSVSADWLYLASLGSFKSLKNPIERVEIAGQNTAKQALRHGFTRLGVVTFGGACVDDLDTTASALVNSLVPLAQKTTVVWFEDNSHRYKHLRQLLMQDKRVKVTTKSIAKPLLQKHQENDSPVIVNVSLTGGHLRTHSIFPSSAGVGLIQRSSVSPEVLDNLSKGYSQQTPHLSKLLAIGNEVAALLFGDHANALLTACSEAKFTIIHDVASSQLPFESLVAQQEGADDVICPAIAGGVNRHLAVEGLDMKKFVAIPPHTGRLKVLLVVNPTSDLENADDEGYAVKAALKDNEAIELTELWHADATSEAVIEALSKTDVLHYSGHAFYDGPGEEESGLSLCDRKVYLTDLKERELSLRLAFVNACESARVRGSMLDGASSSFAEYFLRSGAEAYLGTYWEVLDDSAASFASSVYTQLASGMTVDQSVRKARENLFLRESKEWANYLLYGDGRFCLVTS